MSSNSLAGLSLGGPLFFLSPAKRLESTDRDLLTNLAQSCKPAAVGMCEYSSSVNICSTERVLYTPKDNLKQFLANYIHANYYIRVQEKCPLQWGGGGPVEHIQT